MWHTYTHTAARVNAVSSQCMRVDDKSDSGVTKAKVFVEMLASAGTSASSMVVIDLVKAGRLNKDRDAAMALTKVIYLE